MRIGKGFFIIALCFAALGKVAAAGSPAAGKPVVAVSILPQAYFVERIAGDRARVLTIVGPGQSPHSYEPSPRQMAEFGKASLWFTVGVEFENTLKPKLSSLFTSLRIIDTVANVTFRDLEAHSEEGEEGNATEEHHDEESGRDPHVWIGRRAVQSQAAIIRDAFISFDPPGEAIYKKNFDAFIRDMDSVFESLARDLLPLRNKPVFVYHPAFGYFLDEFGIEQVAVETGGKEPTPKGLAELVSRAKKEGATIIFVQAQFPTSAAKSLAKAIGGVVVAMDPLAPDWLANLKRMGDALRRGLR